MVKAVLTLYEKDTDVWPSIDDLSTNLGFERIMAQTTSEYVDSQGVPLKFSREVIESATRVNYGQVHAVISITFEIKAYMLFRTVKRTLSNFLKPVKMLNDVSMYKA